MNPVQAARLGLARCACCGLLQPEQHRCPRCGSPLHVRKHNSVRNTWALLITGYILYLPANLLPITRTQSPLGVQTDTILSGIAYLWSSGSWAIALVVLLASIVVPLLKLLTLTALLIGVQRRSGGYPRQRSRLYRILEIIGRWSMLDIYVVTILAALVRIDALATITPQPGVIAFAAVVVSSMLATAAFDPRSIWDFVDDSGQTHQES